MWPEEYGVQFLWVEVVFLFIIEACADCEQLLFSFDLGVSNSHSVFFGDPCRCKPGTCAWAYGGKSLFVSVCGCRSHSLHDRWDWLDFLPPVFDYFPQNGCEWKTNHLLHTLSPPSPVNQQAEWIQMEPTYVSCIRVVESLSKFPHAPSHSVITRKQFVFIFELSRCMSCWRGGVGPWWIGCMVGRAAGACGVFSVHGFRDKGWHRTNTDLCFLKKHFFPPLADVNSHFNWVGSFQSLFCNIGTPTKWTYKRWNK